MILTKLHEYANTLNLPPAMYGETKIGWLIDLRADGSFEGCIPWKGDTKATKRGKTMVAPHAPRTVGVKPKLLADTGEYVLGIGRPDSKPQRVADCHQQFKALVEECASATQEPTVQAIAQFLKSWNPQRDQAQLPKDFDPSETVTFRVDGIIPADANAQLNRVQQFWEDYTAGGEAEGGKEKSPIMTCLVTGELLPVEKRLPFLVKGLWGGQPSGTALVSANAPPFTSYGLQNSLTSPISRDAAERFTKALNHLIAASNSRINVGSTTYVFWTREQTQFNAFSYLANPDPQAVKNLLESPYTAQQTHGLQANDFYALALSASAARAVVRGWIETTVPTVESNLKQWFQDQKIVDPYGEAARPLSVYALAASVYRDASKEMLPAVPTVLVNVALSGGRLPDDLLARLVRRSRVERDVTYPRAALIKLVLTTQNRDAMSEMQTLNPNPQLEESDRCAYHCGRLLAQLESIQRAAIGKVNASLTDRYYGAASSAPANAFAPLMRGARAHLSKLRKTAPGTCNALEERLEEITAHLQTFPKTLTMHNQGLFALGYYHQRAVNRATAKATSTNQLK
jgi:CRISPR-associated protein Csd1